MSYTRDRDSYTRGAGAISAYDMDPRRQQQRRHNLMVSELRDRQLAGLTFGERGGLGAAPVGGRGSTGGIRRPTLDQGGGPIEGQNFNPLLDQPIKPIIINTSPPPLPPRSPVSSTVKTLSMGPDASQPKPGTRVPPTRPFNKLPVRQQPTVPPPQNPAIPVVITGGGGGAGLVSGGGGKGGGSSAPAPWRPDGSGTPLPITPIPDVVESSSNRKWWLLAAAIGVGGYLCYRNKQGT